MFLTQCWQEYQGKLGCSPPWFTGNYSKVCPRLLTEEEVTSVNSLIYNHFDMTEFAGCLRPCTRLDIHSRKLRYCTCIVHDTSL